MMDENNIGEDTDFEFSKSNEVSKMVTLFFEIQKILIFNIFINKKIFYRWIANSWAREIHLVFYKNNSLIYFFIFLFFSMFINLFTFRKSKKTQLIIVSQIHTQIKMNRIPFYNLN